MPGTVSAKPTKNPKKKQVSKLTERAVDARDDLVARLSEESPQDHAASNDLAIGENGTVGQNIAAVAAQDGTNDNKKVKRKSGV